MVDRGTRACPLLMGGEKGACIAGRAATLLLLMRRSPGDDAGDKPLSAVGVPTGTRRHSLDQCVAK